jgi:hypothetical protein
MPQVQGSQALQQPPFGGGFRAHMQKILQPVADELGIPMADLQDALGSGKSLADIAQSKGVSRDDLVKVVADAIQQTRPAGAPQLDPTQLANRMVDHVRGHHAHRGHGAAGAGGGSDPDGDTDALARTVRSPGEVRSTFGSGLQVDLQA